MREIKDSALLEQYLKKYHIRELFDTPDLPFRLVEYAPGELINLLHPPEKYLKFLLEGQMCVYSISGEGDRYMHGRIDRPCMIGEVEFCGQRFEDHWHEAVTTLRCVELYLDPIRETLWNDNRFLRAMLHTFAVERHRSGEARTVRESSCRERLLKYLNYAAVDNTLTRVDEVADLLHCSTRQLLRELKLLVENGQVEKLGKGKYRLVKGQ